MILRQQRLKLCVWTFKAVLYFFKNNLIKWVKKSSLDESKTYYKIDLFIDPEKSNKW